MRNTNRSNKSMMKQQGNRLESKSEAEASQQPLLFNPQENSLRRRCMSWCHQTRAINIHLIFRITEIYVFYVHRHHFYHTNWKAVFPICMVKQTVRAAVNIHEGVLWTDQSMQCMSFKPATTDFAIQNDAVPDSLYVFRLIMSFQNIQSGIDHII